MEIPKKEKLKKLFLLFISIYITISFALIVLTAGKDFYKPLTKANVLWLLYALFCTLVFMLLDAWRLKLLSSSFGKSITMYDALDIILSGILLAMITPFGLGGLPYQLWILKGYGYTIAQAMSLIISRGFVIFVPYIVLMPIAYKHISGNLMKFMFIYIVVVALIVMGVMLLKKDYREKIFAINYKYLLIALTISIPTQVVYLSILFFILKSFGLNVNYISSLSTQLIIQLSTYFSPSPGGMGFAEAISSFLLKEHISKEILGYVVILWRTFTAYMLAILGFLFVMRRLKSTG